jgi:LemA protein
MRVIRVLLALLAASVLAGCGYNEIQSRDEAVKAAWAEVISQYQRRADLIPNIVETVKGEADFERGTLTQVIEARARANCSTIPPPWRGSRRRRASCPRRCRGCWWWSRTIRT